MHCPFATGASRRIVGRHNRNAGSLQIEVVIALGVLVVALLSFSKTVTKGIQHQGSVAERDRALSAARQVVEDLRAATFEEVWVRHNGDTLDDPALGVSPGSGFDVAGLQPLPADPDGRVGELLFPESGGNLREDLDLPRLGLPFDLDRDGSVTSDDVSGDYRLLPVEIRVQWRSAGSNQRISLVAWLGAVQ